MNNGKYHIGIVIVAIFALSVVILSACSNKEVPDNSKTTDKDDIVVELEEHTNSDNGENDDGTVSDDVFQSKEEEIEDKVTANNEADLEILHFVDVFGEEYEVEINPLLSKHDYVSGNFLRDGDMLYYEDNNYKSRLGIDVSYHQGTINWGSVAEAGYEFAILRVGFRGYGKEGKINKDSKFEEYYKSAKDAGLDIGVYFFSQAINDDEALEEAEFVIDVLNGRDLDLPVTYDPESILDTEARTDNVSGEQFTRNTEIFCKRIKEAGYEPMIYSNMLWEAYNLDLTKFDEIPLWYADYEPFPQTPYRFEYWQYWNEAKVKGVSGMCDVDIQFLKK